MRRASMHRRTFVMGLVAGAAWRALAAVQQSTVVALVANLKTLKSLCLAVSEALLARADQAIE